MRFTVLIQVKSFLMIIMFYFTIYSLQIFHCYVELFLKKILIINIMMIMGNYVLIIEKNNIYLNFILLDKKILFLLLGILLKILLKD